MSWQPVDRSYDFKYGERFRVVVHLRVQPYLKWLPEEVYSFLVEKLAWVMFEARKRLTPRAELERYEVEAVKPGEEYRVYFYGIGKGITAGVIIAVLLLVLGIALTIAFIIAPERVERLAYAGIGILLLAFLILKALERR
ncbi:MAG: hypothetical protein QW290_09290 [Sulfolobales archaeon]